MMQFHHYSLSDLENLISWERYLYIDMLKAHVQEENDKARERAMMQQRNLAKRR